MKRIIFIGILFLVFAANNFGQIQKETYLIGGSAGLYFSTERSSYLSLSPSGGYFLTDNICLGAYVPVFISSNTFLFGINPFGRYYFTPKSAQSLYALGGISLTGLFESENFYSDDILTLGTGYTYLLNPSIGFESEIILSTDFEDLRTYFQFGFQIYFSQGTD